MRTSTSASIVALAASSQVSAQYTNQSDPFNLVISSTNTTLNGNALYPCNEGAAIEGLCVGQGPTAVDPPPFRFNTSSTYTVDHTIGVQGLLAYLLVGGNFQVSEPMQLSYNPTSNVALPPFEPSESGTQVGFDDDGKMLIAGFVDDRQTNVTYKPERYYRWYACTTYGGYTYNTLAWGMGEAVPQNPTCQKVDAVRVY